MTETQDLTLFSPRNALQVITDREEFDRFYEEVRQAVASHQPDVTTQKGRDAIKALAFKVTKTKTYLDSEGKRLTETARATIKAVDESRRHMREKLDALKDEARAPLDKWEEQEAARQKLVQAIIDRLKHAAIIPATMTFDEAHHVREQVREIVIEPGTFGSLTEELLALRRLAFDSLTQALDRLKREEEDRAELARLRAEQNAREQDERDRRFAAQEAERVAAEKHAEEKRRERAAEEQKAREQRAAEVAAAARERELKEQHEAELHAERMQRAKAEEAQRAREEQDKKAAEEQRQRDQDKAHRQNVLNLVHATICKAGDVTPDQAKKITLAILAGVVPHVSLKF
jgi:colicin import membrane protein